MGFKVAKRKRDWLLGRWTAKHLVQTYLAITHNRPAPLDQIEILADVDGAPYARLGMRLPLSLSISHSGRESFCALCDENAGYVGADIEQIEPRDLSLVRTFFTAPENTAGEAVRPEERDRLITALWSAKEAVLKTLRLGLRADTRQLNVVIGSLSSDWSSIGIDLDPLLLAAAPANISAWSQVHRSTALSLALLS
jgi:4'-phosphopantetheinyl transferase